jgi:fructokinase/2-dehydro-3-deoxygluconokinase
VFVRGWTNQEADGSKGRRFDVISAGEAHVRIGAMGRSNIGFVAGRGAIGTALAVARADIRVGLATAIDDDSTGRALVEQVSARGVDVGGVAFRRPDRGVVLVDAMDHADEIVPFRDEERPFTIPKAWSSAVLVLSGLTPVVSIAGSLCQAARAARRAGAVVVVAVEASPHVWRGRDARAVRMVLREADVVRYTLQDLDVLKMDALEMRAATRDEAVHVMTNTKGDALATGPFGEVERSARRAIRLEPPDRSDDPLTTAICIALARAGEPGADRRDVWDDALAQGQALAASA